MNRDAATIASIQGEISKGWKPNYYLTNMSVAHFQPDDWFVTPTIFPILQVQQSTGLYYIFDKGDLARDNVARKPQYGKVSPLVFASKQGNYACKVDQVIVGIDQIAATDYQRAGTPGMADPRRAKVRIASEQMKLHMDRSFAKGFFNDGAWTNVFEGKATPSTATGSKEFNFFDDANFDPVEFFGKRKVEMMREGRRMPNVLSLGVESYEALKCNPSVLDRVKYSGSTANPATVNANVIAQLLEIERVVVLNSTYNAAGIGKTDMQFVCDSTGALLTYSTPTPAIDEATAGYMIAWDMLGNGQYLAFDQWEGEKGTHSEFIEGLISYDAKKICDELGMYFVNCAKPN